MKIKATITPIGSIIPILVRSTEVNLNKLFIFLIDNGASFSTINAVDFPDTIDYTKLQKSDEISCGIGGIQISYLIHDVTLYFLSTSNRWFKGKKIDTLKVLPPLYNNTTHELIPMPSILGIDIIGLDCNLYYKKKKVYLKWF